MEQYDGTGWEQAAPITDEQVEQYLATAAGQALRSQIAAAHQTDNLYDALMEIKKQFILGEPVEMQLLPEAGRDEQRWFLLPPPQHEAEVSMEEAAQEQEDDPLDRALANLRRLHPKKTMPANMQRLLQQAADEAGCPRETLCAYLLAYAITGVVRE